MARRRLRDWPVTVYSYGVLPSFKQTAPDWLKEEAFTMNRLWNDLVAIGRRYLDKYRQNLDEDPRLAPLAQERNELSAEIEEVTKRIKRLRQKLRKRTAPEIEALLKEREALQERLKAVKAHYRTIKPYVAEERKALWREMEEEVNRKLKEYYPRMYWANWEAIRDRFWTAWRKGKQGGFPKFHSLNGNWTFTWRFQQGGKPVKSLVGKVIDRIPPEEVYSLPRRKRHKQAKVTAVLTAKGKKVEVPFIMHRPLPENGIVKRIVLVRREHGTDGRHKWFINFTVEVPPEDYRLEVPAERKPLAVLEVGFRKLDETKTMLVMPTERGKVKVECPAEIIRVGVLYDGEKFEEICLPEKVTAKVLAALDKQAKADRILQELKDDLWRWFREEGILNRLPEEVKKEVAPLFRSKTSWGRVRKRKLVKLARTLKRAGVFEEVADEVFDVLNEWTRLISVASRMKKKALGYRDKFYENLAVRLFNEYERLIVAQIDMKRLSEKEEAEKLPQKARFQRVLAGISKLVNLLERRAERTGSVLEKVVLPYKTRKCHVCGVVNEPENPAKREWICEGCGSRWDQDYNAVLNLWEEKTSN